MDIEQIDAAFEAMISERNIHRVLEIDSQNVRNYRQYLKVGQPISLELKISLLRKAGRLPQDEKKEFARKDLVDLVSFVYKEKVQHEPDYAVHKFLLKRREAIKE